MRLHPLAAAIALALAACSGGAHHVHVATASIGAAGGNLEIAEGVLAGLLLQVPPNALAGDVHFTADDVLTVSRPGFSVIGPGVAVGPDVSFRVPALLTIPYVANAYVDGQIVVLRRDGTGAIVELEPLPLSPSAALASVEIDALGTFWVAERLFLGVATQDFVPLDDGNVWQLGELTIAVDTVGDEPNLGGATVSRATFALPGRESGLYLQRDFLTGATDLLGWFERSPAANLQLLNDATPLLGAAITLGQPAEHLFTFAGHEPFGASASTFSGLGHARIRGEAAGEVETNILTTVGERQEPLVYEDVVRVQFELQWRDEQGGSLVRRFVMTFARFVGPVEAELDGVRYLLDSGFVAGSPLGG